MRAALLLLALSATPALVAAPVVAAPVGDGTIEIQRPWARATAPGQVTGVVYATLLSAGGDRLLGVASPAAEMAMLHDNVAAAGNSTTMRDLADLAIPPNTPVTLRPGGLHIMLMGLRRPLVAGAIVSVALTFQHAGRITVPVPIEPLNATGPDLPAPGHP